MFIASLPPLPLLKRRAPHPSLSAQQLLLPRSRRQQRVFLQQATAGCSTPYPSALAILRKQQKEGVGVGAGGRAGKEPTLHLLLCSVVQGASLRVLLLWSVCKKGRCLPTLTRPPQGGREGGKVARGGVRSLVLNLPDGTRFFEGGGGTVPSNGVRGQKNRTIST